MQGLDARLTVILHQRDARIEGLTVQSSRRTDAAHFFHGRSPDDVLRLLPNVFSLCGTAQALAGLSAMEAALSLFPALDRQQRRRRLLAAEMVCEHGLNLFRDAPALLGEAPNIPLARACKPFLHHIRQALYPTGGWNSLNEQTDNLPPVQDDAIQGALQTLDPLLTHGLGRPLAELLTDPMGWASYCDSPPARLLRSLMTAPLAGLLAGGFMPMPEHAAEIALQRLTAPDADEYCQTPDVQGTVPETGPLVRQQYHPAVAAMLAQQGADGATRLVARLADLSAALHQVAQAEAPLPPLPAGAVEAVRGLLVHRVELSQGKISRYHILAPTEWNFHPHGALARGLLKTHLSPHSVDHLRMIGHMLDPCVPVTFHLDPANA